jgi:hypothetical protein
MLKYKKTFITVGIIIFFGLLMFFGINKFIGINNKQGNLIDKKIESKNISDTTQVNDSENKSDSRQGKCTIKVIDSETKEQIENSTVIITDLGKKFDITKSNNIIELPPKPTLVYCSEYQHGYTIITFSKGYLPSIIHSIIIFDLEGIIQIELSKPQPGKNIIYTEEVNLPAKTSILDLLGYYTDYVVSKLPTIGDDPNSNQGKRTIKVIDSETKKEIENALVIITDLGKKINVTKSNNTIKLPAKPTFESTGKYQDGYSILTLKQGYLPRIDHNMTVFNDTSATIVFELTKLHPGNDYCTKVDYKSDKRNIINLLDYYLGKGNY